MKITVIGLISCLHLALAAIQAMAGDESDQNRSILKFNCIDREETVTACKTEAIAQLMAMGCKLEEIDKNAECARLNDEVMCQLHTSNCQKTTLKDKKTVCPDGFSKEPALEPVKCPSCDGQKYYNKASKSPAIFDSVYYCKK